MAEPITTEIDLINAALTATGNSPITSFEDGTSEAEVAAANFERIVGAELEYPWTWTHQPVRLNRVDVPGTDTAWLFAYQVPDAFEVERLEVAGRVIPWESMSDLVLCNVEEDVFAIGRGRPPVENWPAGFRHALALRLEALFLRALSEDFDKAEARDKAAARAFGDARRMDARRRSPRQPARSVLLEARGALGYERETRR